MTDKDDVRRTADAETIDTVVVGASAAGLAVAASLRRAGVPFVLLEESAAVGAAWRGHYDRLHLHTSKGLSALPYRRWPRAVPRYPSRAQMVSYLEDYASHFRLEPRFGQRVTRLRRDADAWVTETDRIYRSTRVVLATGNAHTPHVPAWPGLESFGGPVLHSSQYRNGQAWKGKRVLVVGIGNSGGEIALDLCGHGVHPSIAVRSAVNLIPRDFLGLPILAWAIVLGLLPTVVADAIAGVVARLTVGRVDRLGMRKLPYGPMTQIRRYARVPLLDIGTVARIRRGEIEILPEPTAFSPGHARFSDGSEHAFDAVVLATGYLPAVASLLEPEAAEAVASPDRLARGSGGELLPGLFLCGYYVAPTGMLREIAREARRIARAIATRAKQTA